MKKVFKLSLFLFALTFFVACNKKEVKTEKKEQNNTFTISGEIKGLGNTNMHFRMPDETQEKKFRWDSIVVKNNKFSYSSKIDKLEILKFWIDNKSIEKSANGGGYFPVLSNNLMLFVFPGADVKVSGEITEFVNAYPSEDKINNDLTKLHKKIYPLINKGGDLSTKISFEEDKNKRKELEISSNKIDNEVLDIKKSFINDNINSAVSIWYLSDLMMRSQLSDEESIEIFNKVDKKLSDNPFYKDIAKRIQGINATKEGQIVPAIITSSTVDGVEFDLASYRGKYVMIDFWGTWCGPCVAEMPKVSEYVEKYKGKLEILGVNSGDSKKRMADFLEKNDYKWQQVLNVKGESNDNFVLKFNVTGFPTKFIIDPDGKIVKKYMGNGEESFVFLDSILK